MPSKPMCKNAKFGPVQAIFFDIDDTLFPSTEFAEQARRNAVHAMIEAGLPVASSDEAYCRLLRIVGQKGPNYERHFDDLCAYFAQQAGKKPGGKKYGSGTSGAKKQGSRNPASQKLNTKKIVAAGIAAYHNTKAGLRPYPEVTLALLKLRVRGYKLYAATYGNELKQWDKLFRLGLHLFFTEAFVTQKKDARFFRRLVSRVRLRPRECLMVGDKPESDIAPAAAAGMWTVRVLKGKHQKEKSKADLSVSQLSELLLYLRNAPQRERENAAP